MDEPEARALVERLVLAGVVAMVEMAAAEAWEAMEHPEDAEEMAATALRERSSCTVRLSWRTTLL